MYCNTETGVCFLETCKGMTSTPPVADDCALIYTTCQNGTCSATTGCTAANGVCRSNEDGSGTAGVCNVNTGLCEECQRGVAVDGTTITSTCSGATAYCNILNDIQGNYCGVATCVMDAASATLTAQACPFYQDCDITGSGNCANQLCVIDDDCESFVCGSDKNCAPCNMVNGEGTECPKNSDTRNWYTCYEDGICRY